MKYSLGEKQVQLRGEGQFIAPNAAVIGDVTLHENASVWFSCVLRGDADSIEVGAGSNIQDGTVVHADPGFPAVIGKNVTVGHNAMIHGCHIGDGTLVGINAVVLNGARIGRGCLIGANALVTEGMEVPDGSMVLGSPAKVVKQLSEEVQLLLQHNADHYIGNAQRFSKELSEQT
ncbi:gamma carbonic anhydrase family protein [Pseudohalioglobus lutimaris]|uniref:Gamma carbonic anhydrase family protein n=1 Tax=Pseudohalioglobus lutimaris TaxID=1737061 RepID=A0A2N5X0U2_9GAMM|nr:gamma carbonic anhydrase family protein [Pseudohalioglobus lutimaris]PLW68070.1 gamma carbonic anhydrase family protein [Pseudohalioglobus lutimaris]